MSDAEPSVHDGELVRRSLVEPHVFCDVYKRHFEPIYVHCVTRVGPADAEDVAQQVFLVGFLNRAKFDFDRVDARPWFCGIARNLCSRHLRTQKQIRHLVYRLPPPPSVDVSDTVVVGRMDAQRLRGPLYAAICELSPSQAETLILYAINDLTHKEIAVLLGIKVGTVKSRLSRAKAHIRACWDTKTYGEIGPDGRPAMKPTEGRTADGTQNGSNGNT